MITPFSSVSPQTRSISAGAPASSASDAPVADDSVTVGSSRPEGYNCWDPRTWVSIERPALSAVINRVSQSDCKSIAHTTRGIPQESLHRPEAPRPFPAGRYEVVFSDRENGTETAYIFQTEAGLGHLQTVTPGQTEIPGGSVSLLEDPSKPEGASITLNPAEVDLLTSQLYARFKSPMSDSQAERLQQVISYAHAIRFSGAGVDAVSGRHDALAG